MVTDSKKKFKADNKGAKQVTKDKGNNMAEKRLYVKQLFKMQS